MDNKANNEFENFKKALENVNNKHSVNVKSFNRPTFCDHCTGFIVGFTSQGVRCESNCIIHLKIEL